MKNKAINLLRKSEKYTKTDMVYLVGQSGWLFLGQGAVFISSLLLAWVFANFIDPSDYGLYKYVLSVATMASITTLTGFSIAITRAVSQGHQVSLPKLIKIRILFGLLGSIAVLTLAAYYLSVENPFLASLFAIASIWIPFYETLSDYQSILQGKKDFRTNTFLRILQRLILTSFTIGAIFITQSILFITFIFFAASTFSHYIALSKTLKKYQVTNDIDTPYQEIINYSKRISLQNIFFVGAGQLDKIILFKLLGPIQLAIYFFAIAIPQEINGLLGNINSVAFPKLVNKESPEFKKALLKKIGIFSILLIFPIISYIIAVPYIFKWFFPSYVEAVFISQLFVGTIVFIPVNLIWQYFYAIDNRRAIWFATFTGPSILILGIILLVPHYGLIGAVAANYIRGLSDLGISSYFFLKKK